jgi:acyl-CoA synthetase (AMP-forming)/AMP-acid ligase II/peptidoglycan/LPS O-acetylase OafA/YrhL
MVMNNSSGMTATALVASNSLAYVSAVFALNEARQPVVTVASEAQAMALPGVTVERCLEVAAQTGWFDAKHPLVRDDRTGQITYTSGTEGQPKGIVLTYANMADAAQRIIDQMQMTAEIREYVGVPASYSFGMGRYRAVSAVGGRTYLPSHGFDPLEFARMLAAGEVNALSAVPTLLRIILANPEIIGTAGERLRWMEIGSQHMTADEKRRTRELFPQARIVQHYGLTEASRSTFLQISEVEEALLGSVGQPVGQTEIELADDGRIRIRGPHVARWSVTAPGLHELIDGEGWLQTNDLGHWSNGYLHFDGRADDLINCGGLKIVPDMLEERIRKRMKPGLQVAVAKVPDAQRGDGILVAAQIDEADTKLLRDVAAAALRDMNVDAGSSLHVMAMDPIPVTATGKTQRRLLAEQFKARQPTETPPANTGSKQVKDVLSLFQHAFPSEKVTADDSFETLGGDSLRYIQFSMGFERRFGPLPKNWQKMSAAELQRKVVPGARGFWSKLEPATFGRAFAMICIVALHTNAFVYSKNWGAAYFLIMLAGYSVTRWQLPEIIRTGSVRTLLGTARYVAIPTVLMLIAMQIFTWKLELRPLFLISNFFDPTQIKGFYYYFAEFYVQLLLLAALFFSFASVRRWFEVRPMASALLVLAAVILIDHGIDLLWNTDYIYHRTPQHYAWPFAVGMILASANDLRTRLVALAVISSVIWMVWGPTSAGFYVEGGCAMVLFVRAFVVPAPVKVVVAEIAGASIFIYLVHWQMMSLVHKLSGEDMPWVSLFGAIILGIAVAHAYAWFERFVYGLPQTRQSFGVRPLKAWLAKREALSMPAASNEA